MNSKRIEIFCTSQESATSVCLNMDSNEASSSSSSSSSSLTSYSSALSGGCRAIDRHNPIIRDPRRVSSSSSSSSHFPPCSSPHQPPPLTTPDMLDQNKKDKNKKMMVMIMKKKKKKKGSKPLGSDDHDHDHDEKKKNIAAEADGNNNNISSGILKIRRQQQGWSCTTKTSEFISPPGSSRYLLGDPPFFDGPSQFDQLLKYVPIIHSHDNNTKPIESKKEEEQSSLTPHQVVVLRVSLHCKGCEKKMRKHISKMEGVSSFNIDFAAKKVTVVGDVTPLQVLTSVSKVKNAKLWMPPAAPVSASASPLTFNDFETKKY